VRDCGVNMMPAIGMLPRSTRKTMNPLFFKALPGIVALVLTPAALHAGPADELIANGDAFYVKLQAAEALKFYLPAEKLEPNNVRLLVRISREYRHLMSDATKLAQKLSLGSTAVDYAKRAAALDPNDPEAQLSVAISYGKLQPFKGVRDRLEASRVIKDAADKVIKLDPRSDLGWHVLGRWHMAFADVAPALRILAQFTYGKLPDSTYEDASRCFEKAIELNPNRLMHYIELGRVFARMGRTDDARSFITKGLAMRDTEKDDPETKRQGQELLAKLQ
jgi:tetratricopeptide (TPR) repeat protein